MSHAPNSVAVEQGRKPAHVLLLEKIAASTTALELWSCARMVDAIILPKGAAAQVAEALSQKANEIAAPFWKVVERLWACAAAELQQDEKAATVDGGDGETDGASQGSTDLAEPGDPSYVEPATGEESETLSAELA